MGVDANQTLYPTYNQLEIVKTGKVSLAFNFAGHAASAGGADQASTIVSHNLEFPPILIMTMDNGTGAYETVMSGSVDRSDSGSGYMQFLRHKFIVDSFTLYIYYINQYTVSSGSTSGYSGTNNYIYYLCRQRTV